MAVYPAVAAVLDPWLHSALHELLPTLQLVESAKVYAAVPQSYFSSAASQALHCRHCLLMMAFLVLAEKHERSNDLDFCDLQKSLLPEHRSCCQCQCQHPSFLPSLSPLTELADSEVVDQTPARHPEERHCCGIGIVTVWRWWCRHSSLSSLSTAAYGSPA